MNCADIGTILDRHSQLRVPASERDAIETHLAECADCALAWRADQALLALRIPGPPIAALLATARSVMSDARTLQPRRIASRTMLLGALLAAGAALATAAYVSWTSDPRPPSSAAAQVRAAALPASSAPGPAADEPPVAAAPQTALNAADRVRFPDGDYFTLIVRPPHYPPAALAEKAEGWVQLRYTIDRDGNTADVEAVESNDPRFEPEAVLAVAQWKYMPRVVDGKRVAVPNIRTVIRFQLGLPPQTAAAPTPRTEPSDPGPNGLDYKAFDAALDPAWECAAAKNLRCAELVLDEVVAAHTLTSSQLVNVMNFYGYIYARYGDYGRATAAFRKAIDAGGGSRASMALAHLYFAQHQYDLALATLREYVAAAGDKGIDRRFLDTLEQLGLTTDGL